MVTTLELASAPGNQRHRVVLDPMQGGRAISWQVDDLELLGSHDAHWVGHGMYPMTPWAGRLRGNRLPNGVTMPATFQEWAIHGTVASSAVEVDRFESNYAELSYRLGSPWPWSGRVRMCWTVGASALHTSIEISSDDCSFPVVVGWHPWFRRRLSRGGSATWELRDARLAPRDADRMPSTPMRPATMVDGPFDDTFFAPADAVLQWPGALTLRIQNSAHWFVVFDELADFLLVEPQSGPPNGINEPLIGAVTTVEPGAPVVHEVSWQLLRDPRVDQA
jgi:aldose 1-epimerase